jgi:hypothetical protein
MVSVKHVPLFSGTTQWFTSKLTTDTVSRAKIMDVVLVKHVYFKKNLKA